MIDLDKIEPLDQNGTLMNVCKQNGAIQEETDEEDENEDKTAASLLNDTGLKFVETKKMNLSWQNLNVQMPARNENSFDKLKRVFCCQSSETLNHRMIVNNGNLKFETLNK